MNVFVLTTGRAGSVTFIEACGHITNFSAGHETRTHLLGDARLDYPDGHIEADNRLSWFLGRLDERFGDDAVYVHLRRDTEATARSFAKRWEYGIMNAYRSAILMRLKPAAVDPLDVARDYCDTVNANIRAFLRDKSRVLTCDLETATRDFRVFWEHIGAEGDLEAALATWRVRHNAS